MAVEVNVTTRKPVQESEQVRLGSVVLSHVQVEVGIKGGTVGVNGGTVGVKGGTVGVKWVLGVQ